MNSQVGALGTVMPIDLQELYRSHGPMVLRRCRRLLCDEAAAADATQDVFVELLRRQHVLYASNPAALLLVTATNLCLNRLRTARRRPEYSETALVCEIASFGRADDIEDRILARWSLDRIFDGESKNTRRIAVLRYVDQLTLKKVPRGEWMKPETLFTPCGVLRRRETYRSPSMKTSKCSRDHLRAALVGFGFIMEEGHAAAYRQRALKNKDVDIVAIADICEARRQRAQEVFPNARIYSEHRALLASEASNLDYVDIATPPCDHAAVALDALDLGLHVLCEKPLACSTELASAMLRRAQQRNRVLFPCHNYKHAPVVKAIRKIIASGDIGSPHLVTLQTFRNTHARGVAAWRPSWRRERHFSGGGIAMDHGSHTFYLAFEWMGSYPTSITAHAPQSAESDTEEEFSCTLRFPTGMATAHLSWTAGVRKVIYTIHGDHGAIRAEDDRIEIARLRKSELRSYCAKWDFENTETPSDWMDSSHVGWFNSLFDEFKHAIEKNEYVGIETLESLRCIQLIQMGYLSAKEDSRMVSLHEFTSRAGCGTSAVVLLPACPSQQRWGCPTSEAHGRLLT